ncbi:hypothetical protein B0H66DRAFT_629496 [Apodospora peruviana]|uniref:Uncharacterized protein n=1 Tax=Apodospora peruviana TaxID=516989 RepID=A0AAE0HVB1_9PEZI|nr:hypothetical protein B0H66DRAFT_629496 [Apodospora peruviana]
MTATVQTPSPVQTGSAQAAWQQPHVIISPLASSEFRMETVLLPTPKDQQTGPINSTPENSLRPAFRYRLNRLDDGWTWESLSMLLSGASILAIAVILEIYDGHVFLHLPGGITLNAIVSTMSTISKSSLIFTVSAVLGQVKWDWYEEEPRRLDNLETFDQASRGPLDAAKLLFGRRTVLSIASLGAVITILALAVDPFVQQVVGYTEKVSFVDSDEVRTERLTHPSFFR